MLSRACGFVSVGCIIFLLSGCDGSMGSGSNSSSSTSSAPACDETDPQIMEATAKIDQAPETEDGETQINEVAQDIESRVMLLPLQASDGSCTIRPEDWTLACGNAQFSVPMHQVLQCQQIDNGIAFVLSPFSIYNTENIILRVQRVNRPWNDENRIVENIGEETVGHVPVKVEVQKDPLPEDCDPHDPCAWEWKTAPFHYEIRGEKLFREIVDLVTKQLICLDNAEQCPPVQN